ncbi:MAG TPA: hypothetical protein VNJ28_04690 [Candidatus Limnocylindrales bacterium]|nr:hypothetical protein [Candidatus Limnocylindrales bacterium]
MATSKPRLLPCARCGEPVWRRPRPDRKPYHIECAIAVVAEYNLARMREARARRAARAAAAATTDPSPFDT